MWHVSSSLWKISSVCMGVQRWIHNQICYMDVCSPDHNSATPVENNACPVNNRIHHPPPLPRELKFQLVPCLYLGRACLADFPSPNHEYQTVRSNIYSTWFFPRLHQKFNKPKSGCRSNAQSWSRQPDPITPCHPLLNKDRTEHLVDVLSLFPAKISVPCRPPHWILVFIFRPLYGRKLFDLDASSQRLHHWLR